MNTFTCSLLSIFQKSFEILDLPLHHYKPISHWNHLHPLFQATPYSPELLFSKSKFLLKLKLLLKN